MPNHVHLIIGNVNPVLHDVLKRMKQHTGRQANKLLGRTGKSFWHRESYDHIIRNEKEMQSQIAYVLNNPVKAGLVKNWEDWPNGFLF